VSDTQVHMSAVPRSDFGKGAARRLRRTGMVPAVIYGHGSDPVHVALDGHDLSKALRQPRVVLALDVDGTDYVCAPRDIQRDEQHFTRAKSFDTFCPVGPVVVTDLDPLDVFVTCRVNGAKRQRGSTRDMTVDPFSLVSYISHVMTLLPGDVVSTGTPEGVGPIRHGDWVEVEVDGIGVLRNPVV